MRYAKNRWTRGLVLGACLAITAPSWAKSYVLGLVYAPITKEHYVESPLTHFIYVSLTCHGPFGLWGKKTRVKVTIYGTWGAGDRAPTASPENWPFRLTSYRTRALECGFWSSAIDDMEIRFKGGVLPNFPPDFRAADDAYVGDRFYVSACADPIPGVTISPRCNPPRPVLPLQPFRPDLFVSSQVSPSNHNCGLRIRTRVENRGNVDAHRFKVRIERSRNGRWGDQDDQTLYESRDYQVTAGSRLGLVYRTPDPIQYTGCRSVGGRQVCDPVRIRVCATKSWPVVAGGHMRPEIRWEDNLADNCATTTLDAPIWDSDHYRRCQEAGGTATGELVVTADDGDQVYLNGALLGSSNEWTQASTYPVRLQNGVNVIAIRARDGGGAAGLLAQLTWRGNVSVSNADWKVSATRQPRWEAPDFDDSGWQPATSFGRYGAEPWGRGVTGFPVKTNAEWIWAADNQDTDEVFFRFRLVVP